MPPESLQERVSALFGGRWRNGMVVTNGVDRWRMLGGIAPEKLVRVPLVPFAGAISKSEALYPDIWDVTTQLCLRDLVQELLQAPDMHPEVEGSPEKWTVVVRVAGWPPFFGPSYLEALVQAGEGALRGKNAC